MESVNPELSDRPIRILLLDRASLFRVTLGRFLRTQADLEVAAECGSAAEALQALPHSTVNLVLADIGACSENGGALVSAAREAGYQGRFLMISESLEGRQLAVALKQGVSGIVVKSEDLTRLLQAIRRVAGGELSVDRQVIFALVDGVANQFVDGGQAEQSLSREEREQNVLRGILCGLSNRKIARSMGLSESSVKYIVQRLFVRAGVTSRSQLVKTAIEDSMAAGEPYRMVAGGNGAQSNE